MRNYKVLRSATDLGVVRFYRGFSGSGAAHDRRKLVCTKVLRRSRRLECHTGVTCDVEVLVKTRRKPLSDIGLFLQGVVISPYVILLRGVTLGDLALDWNCARGLRVSGSRPANNQRARQPISSLKSDHLFVAVVDMRGWSRYAGRDARLGNRENA
jgi:hypothetical protein